MEKLSISANTVVEFLGVPRSSLNTWLKGGILGEKYLSSSQGTALEFSLEDAIGARIAKATLDTFKDYYIARQAVSAFRSIYKSKVLATMPHMTIMVVDRKAYVSWAKPGFAISTDSGTCATTVIFVDEIVKEVAELFTDTKERAVPGGR